MFDARFAPFLDMAVLVRAAVGRLREKRRQAREFAAAFEQRQELALDLGTKRQRTARELRELCAASRPAWAPPSRAPRAGEETVGSGPAERVDSSPAPGAHSRHWRTPAKAAASCATTPARPWRPWTAATWPRRATGCT